jgi:hypothetical protein
VNLSQAHIGDSITLESSYGRYTSSITSIDNGIIEILSGWKFYQSTGWNITSWPDDIEIVKIN